MFRIIKEQLPLRSENDFMQATKTKRLEKILSGLEP